MKELSGWIAIGVELLMILGTAIALMSRMNTKSEEHDNAIAAERVARDKAIREERDGRIRDNEATRKIAEEASESASTLHSKMLENTTAELARLRHDINNMRQVLGDLGREVARADGRREAFEELVKRMLDRQEEGGRKQ